MRARLACLFATHKWGWVRIDGVKRRRCNRCGVTEKRRRT